MLFLAVGSLGFVCMLLFDWADSRRWKLKGILWLAAAGCIVSSCVVLAVGSSRLSVPVPLRILGAISAAVFLVLLVFSLFLEIPLARSYRKSSGIRHVIRTGTYALVRHPGVLWFFFLTLSLVPVTGSLALCAAVPLWTGLNVLLVLLEDRVFFPKVFGREYKAYTRRVPFLIPTPSSLQAFFSTFLKRGKVWTLH